LEVNDSKTAAEAFLPYVPEANGGWTRRDATHLLWRTQFGATNAEIDETFAAGLQKTLDQRLSPQPESAQFQSAEELLLRTAFDTSSIADLKAWWLYRMLNSANQLVEKMSLLWHSHFATSNAKVQSVPHMAAQNDLIRQNAAGSFRKLLHGMSRDVAMLVWLDGNANRKRQPNENFAREVMELFSLDVGHYTEQDIKEAARAFSGWQVREGKFWFNPLQHDSGSKTVFGKTGNFDGDDIVELCLAQDACPRFLALKILRTFVVPAPDAGLIDGLAQRIRFHDFAMGKVLRELFGSQLFFSPESRNAIIKGPVELVLGAYRSLESHPNLAAAVPLLAALGQDILEPPTVKGWDGGRLWISSTSMLQRANFAAELITGNRLGTISDPERSVAHLALDTPEAVVHHYGNLLLNNDLDPDVMARLANYISQAQGSRDQRIRGVIQLIMTMPEFQLV
jgi:uncharacterized protein (DUF1800 family)